MVPNDVLSFDPDDVDAALKALWRGDSSGFDKLLHASGNPTPPGALGGDLLIAQQRFTTRSSAAAIHIEGFRILREIGRGGMGVVYAAEQLNPPRTVALKLLKHEFATEDMLRRFDREVRLLARLQHPGIASVHGAGTFQGSFGSQPYCVMELVEGERITDFAANRDLTLEQRLELLCGVCEAVQYAHQKGVIHRDLKPDNILVVDPPNPPLTKGGLGGVGRPKVLDFGVARLVDDTSRATLQTEPGGLVGTLPYMSPEQLTGDAHAVDTRSDVYSLGVVAFELLTGKLPFDLAGRTPPQAIRVLAEQEPMRAGMVRADLAADIRRHLRHEPVVARPPRALYQLRKFARRNRGLVTGAVLAVAALLAGTIGTATFAWWETRQAERATEQAGRAEAIIRFLRQMLASVDPTAMRGKDVTVRQVLDEAAERILAGELADQPEVEAALRSTIGETYLSLGYYAEARTHLEAALSFLRQRHGMLYDDVIAHTNLLAKAMVGLAEFAEGERLHRQALDACRNRTGFNDARVAVVLSDLGHCLRQQGKLPEAEDVHRQALALRRSLAEITPLELGESLTRLGVVLRDRSQWEESESLLREALDLRRRHLPPDHPDLAAVLNELGRLLYLRNMLDEAEPMLREAVDIYRRTLDARHPDLAPCLNNLAMLLKRGRNPEAIDLMREALDIQMERLGPDHPEVGEGRLNLAVTLEGVGRHEEADRESRLGLDIMRRAFGERHQTYAFALHNVALGQVELGDPAGAEPLLREALEIVEEQLGSEHEAVIHVHHSLAATWIKLERYDDAAEALETILVQRRKFLGERHDKVGITCGSLAVARLRLGDLTGAVEAAETAISILRPDQGSPVQLAAALLALVEARIGLNEPFDPTETDELVEEALGLFEEQFGDTSWQVADARRVRGLLYAHFGDNDQAESELRGALQTLAATVTQTFPQNLQTRRRTMEAIASLNGLQGENNLAAQPIPDE